MKKLLLFVLLCLPVYGQHLTLVVPYRVDVLTWLQRNDMGQSHATDSGLHFGHPVVEREGVTNRRMAFCHPFTEDNVGTIRSDLRWAAERLSQKLDIPIKDIIEKYVTIRRDGGLPDDWRYPIQ